MDTLLIRGGFPLHGNVRVQGSKFSIIPILAGTLLVNEEVRISLLPPILDAYNMLSLLCHIGAAVYMNGDTVSVNAKTVNESDVPDALVGQMRGTFLLFPALLVRRGHATIGQPQGCQIGPRPFFEHMRVIASFGVDVSYADGRYAGTVERDLRPSDIELFGVHPSPGATKTFLIMAAATQGTSVLRNASVLPEVAEFCRFLGKLSVDVCIEGATITVQRFGDLHGCAVALEVDRIECLTWAVVAGITNGEITVTNGASSLSTAQEEWRMLQSLGLGVSRLGADGVTITGARPISGGVDIETGAYPAFNTDAHPLFTSLLMKGAKPSTVTENVFGTYRFSYLEELQKMGGLFGVRGNSVQIFPSLNLRGSMVHGSDIRATASVIAASMGAGGESVVSGIEHFRRGYGNFVQKAQKLGASIRECSR